MIDTGKSNIMIDILLKNRYNILDFGVWRSLVSRLVRVQEASGSNPDTPTKMKTVLLGGLLFLHKRNMEFCRKGYIFSDICLL